MAGIVDAACGFNPRTRAGCDDANPDGIHSGGVSIHAPARDATQAMRDARQDIRVSIHAPARDATHNDLIIRSDAWVSIHAPARDATRDYRGSKRMF